MIRRARSTNEVFQFLSIGRITRDNFKNEANKLPNKMDTPIYSDVNFLESILRHSENDESIKVSNVVTNMATATGDNYLSYMVRVGIDYTSDKLDSKLHGKKSFIVKIAPIKGDPNGMLVEKLNAFEKEIEMLKNTLPKMNKILNENYRLCPDVYYTKIGNPSLLVMEDLSVLGYQMVDRQAGLDLEHSMDVMRGLAKFHASSVAIYEEDPNSVKLYERGIYHRDNPDALKEFIKNGMNILSGEVAKWKELDFSYSEKISKLSEVCYEKASEYTKVRDDEFRVINHGDCWINNIMFRYDDEGKLIDHVFVDFQICVWSTPAIDLMHFLSTSPSDRVYTDFYDTLIDEYAKTLAETMTKMGCKTKPPSAESLRKCLKERELLEILSSCNSLPYVLIDKSIPVSASDILSSNANYVNATYRGEAYRKIMTKRLKIWNSRGALDI